MICQVTEELRGEAIAWQNWTLDSIYPILWLDGIIINVCPSKQIFNKSAHVVLCVSLRGEKDVLGLWIAENEGASSG